MARRLRLPRARRTSHVVLLLALGAAVLAAGCGDDDPEGPGDAGRADVATDTGDAPTVFEAGGPDAASADLPAEVAAVAPPVVDAADAADVADLAPGGDGASACQIPCLVPLERDCGPAGACVDWYAYHWPDSTLGRVFDNGIRFCWNTFSSSHAMMGNSTFTVKKADGSTCYEVSYRWMLGVLATFSFHNAAGEMVATGTYDLDGKPAITCNGELYRAAAAATCAPSRNVMPSVWPPVPPPSPPCTREARDGGC